MIRHVMNTQLGNSGSPILQEIQGDFKVRGVHNANAKKLGVDHMTGILFRQQMVELIKEWLSINWFDLRCKKDIT